MKKHYLIAVFGLSINLACVSVKGYSDANEAVSEAYKHLKVSKCVSLNETGIVGYPSTDLQALRFLLAQPNAAKFFINLFHENNTIAQIYALYGLQIKNPPLYLVLSLILRKNDSKILIDNSGGCLVFPPQEYRISEILNRHETPRLLTYEDPYNRNSFKKLASQTKPNNERETP